MPAMPMMPAMPTMMEAMPAMMEAMPAMMEAMPAMVTAVTAVCLGKRRRDSDEGHQGYNRQDLLEHRVFSAWVFCIGRVVAVDL